MSGLKFITCCALLPFFAASHALAITLTCQIDVSSEEGGRLKFIMFDYGLPVEESPSNKPHVFMMPPPLSLYWHPPASGNTVDLVVSYDGSTLEEFDAPTGVNAYFIPSNGARPEQYRAIVKSKPAESWRFEQADADFITTQYYITFAAKTSDGKAVIEAINMGKPIEIDILSHEKAALSETFNTSVTTGRDHLLAYARHLIKTQDARVCHAW